MERSDRQAWIRGVLERYEAPLLRYAVRLTGDPERGRDVVQETFFRLCRQPLERIEGRLAPWLFTVCRNRALDVRRKEGRMDVVEQVDRDASAGRRTPPAGPDEAAERTEEQGRLRRALAGLPPKQQEVVRLKFQAGLSYKEIAAVTEQSVGNVGTLLHNALKRLRGELDPADVRARQPEGGTA